MKEEIKKAGFDVDVVYIWWGVITGIIVLVIDTLLAKTMYAEYQQESWLPLFFTMILTGLVTFFAFKIFLTLMVNFKTSN